MQSRVVGALGWLGTGLVFGAVVAGDGSVVHLWDRGVITGHLDGKANEGFGVFSDVTHDVNRKKTLQRVTSEVTGSPFLLLWGKTETSLAPRDVPGRLAGLTRVVPWADGTTSRCGTTASPDAGTTGRCCRAS